MAGGRTACGEHMLNIMQPQVTHGTVPGVHAVPSTLMLRPLTAHLRLPGSSAVFSRNSIVALGLTTSLTRLACRVHA